MENRSDPTYEILDRLGVEDLALRDLYCPGIRGALRLNDGDVGKAENYVRHNFTRDGKRIFKP